MSKQEKEHGVSWDVQVVLGTLLRVGVMTAMAVVLLGGVFYLIEYSGTAVHYGDFTPATNEFSSLEAILKGLKALDSKAIIQLGTVLLIFTPITRVAFSIFSFIIEKDYLYVLIGMFVLAVILFSLSNKLVG